MWYLSFLERAGHIQKQTILECQKGLVLPNTCVPVYLGPEVHFSCASITSVEYDGPIEQKNSIHY